MRASLKLQLTIQDAGQEIVVHLPIALPIKVDAKHGWPTHSLNFRQVTHGQTTYALTPGQAAVLKLLWYAWETGTPNMSEQELLEHSGSQCRRLRDLFRRNPIWGIFIVPAAGRGMFKLDMPNSILRPE